MQESTEPNGDNKPIQNNVEQDKNTCENTQQLPPLAQKESIQKNDKIPTLDEQPPTLGETSEGHAIAPVVNSLEQVVIEASLLSAPTPVREN